MIEKIKSFPGSVKFLQCAFLLALVVYFIMIYGMSLVPQSHYAAIVTFVLGIAAGAISLYYHKTRSWPLALINVPGGIAIYVHYLFMAKAMML